MKKLFDAIWNGEPAIALGVLGALVNLAVWAWWPDAASQVAIALSVIVGAVVRSQVYSEDSAKVLIASPRGGG